MWLPVLGLLFGVFLGLLTDFHIPEQYASFLAVGVMAALDSLFGGIKEQLEGRFDEKALVFGFLANLFLAAGLAFLGIQLGVDLYLAAVFALGVRLFHHLASIREIFMAKRAVRKGREN